MTNHSGTTDYNEMGQSPQTDDVEIAATKGALTIGQNESHTSGGGDEEVSHQEDCLQRSIKSSEKAVSGSVQLGGDGITGPTTSQRARRRRKKKIKLAALSSRTATSAAKSVVEEAYMVKEVVHEWTGITSIHGVPYMLEDNFKLWRKLLWALLVIASATFMTIQVNYLIADYQEYRVVTSTTIDYQKDLSFPDVVFCNLEGPPDLNQTGIKDPKNEEELLAVSYPLRDFILDAKFGGKDMTIEDHFEPVITERGLCFRFTTEKRVSEPGAFVGAGRHATYGSGLFVLLEFRAAGDTTLVCVSERNKTVISQMPLVSAPQNKFTAIGLSRTTMEREPLNSWSRCNASAPPNYTREICRADCWERASRIFRNCTVYGDASEEAKTMHYCSASIQDGSSTTEEEEAMEEFVDHCESELCSLPPCREEIFSMKPFSVDNISESGLLSVISINYETMRVENITESRASTPAQLLANIGGAMGLFLGISAMSLVEIVGELCTLRLLPRLWGDKRLYGLGSREHHH